MEITKLSTKGQVVIPESLRKDFEIGTPFVVSKKNDLIVLKAVSGLNESEEKGLIELEKIWNEIDSGKATKMDFDLFMDEIKRW